MNEEIVVILDANVSMGEEMDDCRMGSEDFLGTTKFDVARCIVQELLFQAASFSRTSLEDQTRILALVILGEGQSKSSGAKRKRPWWPLGGNETKVTESRDYNGCCCYLYNEHDHEFSIDRICTVLQRIRVSSRSSHGDFVQGMVCATETMWKHSTVGAGRRRIVLVTDARHKVLLGEEDPMEGLARAVNTLRSMGCTLEVVGMGFRREMVCNPTTKMTTNSAEFSSCKAKAESDVESDAEKSESNEESSNDDDEEEDDDWSDVQDQNELLVIDLVEKLGGRVQAVNGGSSIDDVYGVETVLKQLAIPFEKSSINSKPKQVSTFEPPYNIVVKEEPIEENNHEGLTTAESIVEKRDVSSLHPKVETQRIHWDGSDDVLLPEWIKTIKPSICFGDSGHPLTQFCSWIQIDDPLQPQKGPTRRIQFEETCLSAKAKETVNVGGYWFLDCAIENADSLWEKIAVATAYGKLGPTSRVFPTNVKENHNSIKSERNHSMAVKICVDVNPSRDRSDIRRVLEVLIKDLNIEASLWTFHVVEFKLPVMHKIIPTNLYTGEEVLAWKSTTKIE